MSFVYLSAMGKPAMMIFDMSSRNVNNKSLPFSDEQLEELTRTYPTPFYLYDEKAIRETACRFVTAFEWVPGGYRNFFAVKALPNPHIMRILHEEGMGMDCSSLAELVLAQRIETGGQEIMFTSNNTPLEEYRQARALDAIINVDDISHLPFLYHNRLFPSTISFRYNPGPLAKGNTIIGAPEDSKYGFTREQLFEGYIQAREWGSTVFGLHTMIASNELNENFFVNTAKMIFELAVELYTEKGITLSFINLGGGVGIPYHPKDRAIDIIRLGNKIKQQYENILTGQGLSPPRIFTENGRAITGPHGYLVTRVIHQKHTYKRYVGVDATMANLMRPGMYGAYHHITVMRKEQNPLTEIYDVTGSLCENNDKFAIDRPLPEIATGDLLVLHDTGAHGHAMGFNYNGKLRSAEVLLQSDGKTRLIRRAETIDDYLRTIIQD